MSAIAEKTQITPGELLRLPDGKDFELVDGELVERKLSVLSSWIGLQIARLLGNHVSERKLGWVFGADNGIQCFAHPVNAVRKPDVSFVKAERLHWDRIGDGWLRLVPDLIVEVISPNDLADDVEEKVEMFYKAGVPLIWVVSPTARTVRILRGDGSSTILREGDQLSGEDVVPGFACPVASIFPPVLPSVPIADADGLSRGDTGGFSGKKLARIPGSRQPSVVMNAGSESPTPDGPTGGPIDWASTLVRHDRWLRTVVAARLGERQAVNEVLQEISLAAVGAKVAVNPERVAGWLYRLAIRKALLYRRSRGRHHKLVGLYAKKVRDRGESPPDPLGWLLLDERSALVREAMSKLPARDAEILLLKYTENWSCRDLANHLGQSEAAIESRLHRARGRLRGELAGSSVIEVRP